MCYTHMHSIVYVFYVISLQLNQTSFSMNFKSYIKYLEVYLFSYSLAS